MFDVSGDQIKCSDEHVEATSSLMHGYMRRSIWLPARWTNVIWCARCVLERSATPAMQRELRLSTTFLSIGLVYIQHPDMA